MSKRSINSNDIIAYQDIYRKMNPKELEEEFNCLSDQMLAYLTIHNYSSAEVLYDGIHLFFVEFRPDLKFMKRFNKDQLN